MNHWRLRALSLASLLSACWGPWSFAVAQEQDISALPGAEFLRKFNPPLVDQARFEPLPPERRILNDPKIRFIARKDGYEFCSRITGIPISPVSRPMACAYWNVKRRECTVVTPEITGFNYVGHEVRHCFEGAFHD
jgi:hypothetical protein